VAGEGRVQQNGTPSAGGLAATIPLRAVRRCARAPQIRPVAVGAMPHVGNQRVSPACGVAVLLMRLENRADPPRGHPSRQMRGIRQEGAAYGRERSRPLLRGIRTLTSRPAVSWSGPAGTHPPRRRTSPSCPLPGGGAARAPRARVYYPRPRRSGEAQPSGLVWRAQSWPGGLALTHHLCHHGQ
jgi:hypothetical protein